MRRVVAGELEIDRCLACGALWFDHGEIRELTDGRLAAEAAAMGPSSGSASLDSGEEGLPAMHRVAPTLSCPRCRERLAAADFQMTGAPVLRCRECGGILAPRRSAAVISAKFRFAREHGELYARLGHTLAGEMKQRMERDLGPASGPAGMPIPLPFVVPLADDGPRVRSLPVVTLLLVAFSASVYMFARMAEEAVRLPGGLPGLPAGAGIGSVSALDLLLFPLLHAGLLPLLAGSLFLLVLGDNVEDRLGWLPYLGLFLACGVLSGAAHLLFAERGGPPALGSAGAVAGVLGAYLILFPDVSIEMYGMGKVAAVPAYIFACAWVASAFLIGPGPFTDLLNPAPLSLAGNLAGFGTGVFGAILWRFLEEGKTGGTPGPEDPYDDRDSKDF